MKRQRLKLEKLVVELCEDSTVAPVALSEHLGFTELS